MWKIRKLDEQLFMGAAAKIHEFLDIEHLMSPEKLSLSKQLGRPLMSKFVHEALLHWRGQDAGLRSARILRRWSVLRGGCTQRACNLRRDRQMLWLGKPQCQSI